MSAADDSTSQSMVGGLNEVRRVGSTVVRPAGPQASAVHAVLNHVRDNGFTGCPAVLEHDVAEGTETLTYLTGEVSNYPLSSVFRSDQALTTAAELLRAFHDATSDFDPSGHDNWYLPPVEPQEVICHGDFAPYNCVVNDGDVTGVFDLDTAHPGPRLWDVGYAAYRWVPLTSPENADGFGETAEQKRRLRLFCDAYGTTDLAGVLTMAVARLGALIDHMTEQAAAGNQAFRTHIRAGHLELYVRDIKYINRVAPQLLGE